MSGSRAAARVVMSSDPAVRAVEDRFDFADSVTVDGTVHVFGVIAARSPGEDETAAFERAFDRLTTILGEAGTAWDDVVEMTTYHIDPAAHFEAFAAVKARYLAPPFPAWTAIGVAALLRPDGIVEIKLTARLSAEQG